ncbi:thioredoxin domain-containing protein [Brevibacillus ginsengisoli]|uniref:thioredoxin domain-containing protein n=1 Tax=Brevibacillus ginsengisoli TaxID=363854 RepID=UPI003CF1925C
MENHAGKRPNRLHNEKSPYLLQHAYNPVDWYSWGDEAFAKAEQENKPIFLSIGYSTCHWCHVMERESFEDEEVAALLNEHFISIKVDREERPDVDHIYMAVCQAVTGSGGWPLTIVMSPEKKPFFAGTYFPKKTKFGRPGMMEILNKLHTVWEADKEKINKTIDRISEAVTPHLDPTGEGNLSDAIFQEAMELYRSSFDEQYGGFGDAPKFPTPHNLLYLLRHSKLHKDEKALAIVEKTLTSMHRGGIYDHVGFGFARYSVDREWLVPHFEKMLYDNALLAYTYLETFEATHIEYYARVAREVFTYVLRDMTDPEGGFYSAEDADSEGEEGKFYVWTPEEVREALGKDIGTFYSNVYDITKHGNFEGHSIPNLIHQTIESFAKRLGKTAEQIIPLLNGAREKLFAVRERRIHPDKDDKILASWNGLMIAALAKGARVLGDERYELAARKAVTFITSKLRKADGRLLARYRDGHAAYLGYVDDYAFLTWGLLELYDATFEEMYLQEALSLTDELLRLFWDKEQGGLFFYGEDAEQLIARPKEIYDGATPSGNGVTAYNLQRLYYLTGRKEFQEYAEKLLHAFGGDIEHYPIGYSFSLMALQLAMNPPSQVVIAGERASEITRKMAAAVRVEYNPLRVVLIHDPKGNLASLAPMAQDKTMVNNKPTLYLCENFACQEPVTDLENL